MEETNENIGRPTTFTPELGTKICDRIALGESTRNILKDTDMPSSSTFYKWLLDKDKKDFSEQYETSCNIRAELMFEELNEIADDSSNDYMKKVGIDGEIQEVPNKEHVQRSRLRVDTRKWYLSKVLPKKFGEKIDMTTNGKDLPIPLLNGLYNNNSNTQGSESQKEN